MLAGVYQPFSGHADAPPAHELQFGSCPMGVPFTGLSLFGNAHDVQSGSLGPVVVTLFGSTG
jgi:hypothetical protein